MKPLFCALGLLTMLAPVTLTPAMAQIGTPFDIIPPAVPVAVKLDNGIVVTPIVVPDDDLRSMLDVKMWHFLVEAPADGGVPQARLELRVPGQPPQKLEITDSGILERKSSDFVVGIAPASGTSLSKADNWNIYYRTRENATDIFSASAQKEEKNPLQDLKFEISRYNAGSGYAVPKPDGSIPLISLYKVNLDPPSKPSPVAELVLVLSTKTPQK